MFRKMPVILIVLIGLISLVESYVPLVVKQSLYALSLTIKSGIVFLLPLIIFSLLFKTTATLAHGATRLILLILGLVCCSNFLSTYVSHFVGEWVYGCDLSLVTPTSIDSLQPLWSWVLPTWIANEKAMFAGVILGIVAGKVIPKEASALAVKLDKMVSALLKGFILLIPLFVAGFSFKLQSDGLIGLIVKDYAGVFVAIVVAQFTYIFLAYVLLNGHRTWIQSVKNMIPAAICGFSTMSSAASMPLTIVGAQNNATHKDLAPSVIPATVNIHLIGDCFAIPILAYAVLKSFGMPAPSMISYLLFTFYFVLAKFSVAAIPGGGIIVMLPILESYLGFNAPMLSLITALYILFDPVITSANIFGNGAFAQLIDRLSNKLNLWQGRAKG